MSKQAKRFYEFGPFRLDTANRLLMHDGEVVPLKQKAAETLLVLVEESTRSRILIEEEETQEQAEAQTATESLPRLSTAGRTKRRTRAVALAAALILAAMLGLAAYRWRRGAAEQTPPGLGVRSIAVLPFKPLGAGGGDDAYLGLGMADALITKLSGTGRLVVRLTGAVLKYADAVQDAVRAGQELGVDCVLEGSIQRQDDRLRLTVHLVRTSDGRPLWAEKFDERVTDVFRLQDSISERVAGALALRLSGEEQKLLAKRFTANPEAYQLYLKGRYFWNKRTEEGLKKSIEYFQQAVELDPDYALAYTGLADSFIQLPGYGATASMEVYPKAKAAAAKALALDPALAEAHNSEAGVLSYFEWDWPAAEEEYRKAVALNPNYASAHHRLGVQLAAMGRPDEALFELKRAPERDCRASGDSSSAIDLSSSSLVSKTAGTRGRGHAPRISSTTESLPAHSARIPAGILATRSSGIPYCSGCFAFSQSRNSSCGGTIRIRPATSFGYRCAKTRT